ncbi:MAG: SDR family oxidoreductase [Alphaproteobacteria bacterium]|nr:SDR family oxidoreductase [Alphaproteobacteria bacterium]
MAPQYQSLFSLDGRVAIVTGASRGIGAAIADTFAEAGAHVVGIGRSSNPDAQPASGVTYTSCDINDSDSFRAVCRAALADHGRVDCLVNNAGMFVPIQKDDDRLPAFDEQIETNLRAAYACSIAAGDQMVEAGNGGSIINITSIGGVRGFSGLAGYAASKGGLEQLTRAMAMDYGPHSIRVNNIAPGYILTDMNKHTLTSDPQGRERRLKRLILKRHGETYEVAAAALFLATDASTYITGETMHVDGGWHTQGMDT